MRIFDFYKAFLETRHPRGVLINPFLVETDTGFFILGKFYDKYSFIPDPRYGISIDFNWGRKKSGIATPWIITKGDYFYAIRDIGDLGYFPYYFDSSELADGCSINPTYVNDFSIETKFGLFLGSDDRDFKIFDFTEFSLTGRDFRISYEYYPSGHKARWAKILFFEDLPNICLILNAYKPDDHYYNMHLLKNNILTGIYSVSRRKSYVFYESVLGYKDHRVFILSQTYTGRGLKIIDLDAFKITETDIGGGYDAYFNRSFISAGSRKVSNNAYLTVLFKVISNDKAIAMPVLVDFGANGVVVKKEFNDCIFFDEVFYKVPWALLKVMIKEFYINNTRYFVLCGMDAYYWGSGLNKLVLYDTVSSQGLWESQNPFVIFVLKDDGTGNLTKVFEKRFNFGILGFLQVDNNVFYMFTTEGIKVCNFYLSDTGEIALSIADIDCRLCYSGGVDSLKRVWVADTIGNVDLMGTGIPVSVNLKVMISDTPNENGKYNGTVVLTVLDAFNSKVKADVSLHIFPYIGRFSNGSNTITVTTSKDNDTVISFTLDEKAKVYVSANVKKIYV